MKSPASFIAITSEGGLLPADFLHELPDPKTSIEGVTPVAYHLAEGERLNEQINRSWNRLKGCWENFKKAIAQKPVGEPTTTDTRERWLFPLFQELGFGRLTAAKPIEVDGRSYPVSHGWNQVPIHLVGSHADLDCRTAGAIGAAKASPHSLVQSALNASEAHLWGIVSNGLNLRLLRDNVALTRLAYVEFDLQAMFDGDLYSEFFVLWLVCHQSRFEGEKPAQFWLERWKKAAEDKTLRALDDLYPGVKKAIAALGAGLVSHRANVVLLEKLRTGRLTTQEFYKQVLRVIYRMLFLLVAEDRALLHVEDDSEAALKARRRYRDFYSLARLRALTLYRSGTPHPDLWQVFQLVTAKLGSDTGCPELALPPLGSFLWTAAQSTPDLLDTLISNRHFLEAVHALTFVQDGNVRRAVDYKNLGSEELGSVYQGLLEMHPRINADAGSFELDIAAGNERKTSGSYYTPDSLVQCLLDSALEPVIAERLAKAKTPKEKETALLRLKVCDKAAGSGHFIIRAGHRIARHLARVRSGEEEPSPRVYQTALRDVIGHCLYGVDVNPMAVELCKVTLWLEALEPGKPLSFLDHHIRCGNSLLGATPELIKGGIPDEAYEAIEGDDKEACSALKKKNKRENPKLGDWFIADEAVLRDKLYQAAAAIDEISDNRPEDIRRKEAAFRNAQQNYDFQKAWDLANLWCAAFVIKKEFPGGASVPASQDALSASTGERDGVRCRSESEPSQVQTGLFGGTEEAPKAKGKKPKAPTRAGSEVPIGITTQHLRDFVEGGALPDGLLAEARRLADQYQFFHWHLAFPEVFAQGGFDVNLGNPPWERLKLAEDEFFASSRPNIANAATSSQRQPMIEALKVEDPPLYQSYRDAMRKADCESRFVRTTGLYPLCGHGDVNMYALFAELNRRLTSRDGRLGCVLQAGIATDKTTSLFFEDIIQSQTLVSFLAFDNKDRLFPAVKTSTRFCLLVVAGASLSRSTPVTFV
ncbi:MAG: N-6 DNA methylase, partial [Limisphaerales bacterium]